MGSQRLDTTEYTCIWNVRKLITQKQKDKLQKKISKEMEKEQREVERKVAQPLRRKGYDYVSTYNGGYLGIQAGKQLAKSEAAESLNGTDITCNVPLSSRESCPLPIRCHPFEGFSYGISSPS